MSIIPVTAASQMAAVRAADRQDKFRSRICDYATAAGIAVSLVAVIVLIGLLVVLVQ